MFTQGVITQAVITQAVFTQGVFSQAADAWAVLSLEQPSSNASFSFKNPGGVHNSLGLRTCAACALKLHMELCPLVPAGWALPAFGDKRSLIRVWQGPARQ